MPLVNAATASTSTSSAGAPLRVINHDSDDDFEDIPDLATYHNAGGASLQDNQNEIVKRSK